MFNFKKKTTLITFIINYFAYAKKPCFSKQNTCQSCKNLIFHTNIIKNLNNSLFYFKIKIFNKIKKIEI